MQITKTQKGKINEKVDSFRACMTESANAVMKAAEYYYEALKIMHDRKRQRRHEGG
jgi:hypothetical protein